MPRFSKEVAAFFVFVLKLSRGFLKFSPSPVPNLLRGVVGRFGMGEGENKITPSFVRIDPNFLHRGNTERNE
jgi:hypothetical protein